MKNSRIVLFGMSLALVLASAGRASAASSRDWSEWMNHYYQAPQADQVVPAVYGLSRSGHLDQAGQSAAAIGFLSTVFAQNPEKVADWMVAYRDLPAAHQRLVAAALWYSNLPDGDRQLQSLARRSSPEIRAAVEQLVARGPVAVRDTPVLSEASLNLQWGAFLASGDQRHIVNALAALGSGEPGLSSAARLALAEKAATHARVYEICQAQLAQQPAPVRDQMQAALAEVRVRR
jgi:hypothetical protein